MLPFIKNKQRLIYIALWILALGLTIYPRLYPLKSSLPDEIRKRASLMVLANLKQHVEQQVEQASPQRSAQEKEIAVRQLLSELVHKEKKRVKESINKLANELKKSGDYPSAKPFLLESDPFLYYGLTENIIQTGKISAEIKGSKYLNELMLAPKGHWEPLNLHPYIGYYIYRIMSLFNPQTQLMYAVSFTPLIITGLSLILFFMLSALLGCQPVTAFAASVFLALAPIFLKRSAFGWYDNDPHNVFFVLLILYLTFLGFRKPCRNLNNILISSFLVSTAVTLYALFWHGWMFILTVLAVSCVANFSYNYFIKKNPAEAFRDFQFFLFLIISAFAGISLIFGGQEFFVLFKEGWQALTNFLVPQLSPWPDLYITVGELHKASFAETIADTGGVLFFLVALTGVFVMLVKISRKEANAYSSVHMTLIVLFCISFILASGARRFGLLFLVPESLCFLLGLHYLGEFLVPLFKKIPQVQRFWPLMIPILQLLCIVFPIKNIQNQLPTLFSRIYDTTWDKTMKKIRNETPAESIINAWWPPGHFIKGMAKRHVTFDGATINVPQAYWMADVFLAKNEKEALGVLRMLNTSANDAAEYLQQETGFSLPRTVNILREITKRNEFEARIILSTVIQDPEKVNEVINFTHRRPPPSYFLIYKENIDDHIQFDFIGNWNFAEIEKINHDPSLLRNVPPRNSREYVDFMWKLAGGPTRFSGPLTQLAQMDNNLYFDENIAVNLLTYESRVDSKIYGHGIPYSLFYLDGDKITERKLRDSNLSYSLMLIKDSNEYKCMLLDRSLGQSLLFQLYYFEGKGMDYFELFSHEKEVVQNTDILVFRINWDKFLNDYY